MLLTKKMFPQFEFLRCTHTFFSSYFFLCRSQPVSKVICFPDEIKIFCIELNLGKKKWLMSCCYNPHKHLLNHHSFHIESAINFYSKTYENLIILDDFYAEISDSGMESFCTINNLKCIIKEPTCYKNPDNPTCIDLILTNFPKNIQELSTLETGLSDFHKIVLTV